MKHFVTGWRKRTWKSMDTDHMTTSSLDSTARADAERAIAILQRVLSEYELQLNPGKTSIIQLPVPIESAWASELRRFSFDDGSQVWDLRRYFDRAFELTTLHRDAEVLKYAIRRLRSVDIAEKNWKLYQDLLLQCAMVEPSSLPAVVDHLHSYKNRDYPVDTSKAKEVLNTLISAHAPLGHGSEVAWSLWGYLLFHLQIEDSTASAVADMEDPFAALLMLHAQDSGLTRARIELQNTETALETDSLYGPLWLLSYEANVKEWLSSAEDHVSRNNQFRILKDHGVSFYDSDTVKSYTPSDHYPPSGGPDGSYPGG